MLFATDWARPLFGDTINDAAQDGDLKIVEAVIYEKPELIRSKDNNGWTPLHYAASLGRELVVEFLLTNQAEVNALTDQEMTPLDWANMHFHERVAKILKQHGGKPSSELPKSASASIVTTPILNVGDWASHTLIWNKYEQWAKRDLDNKHNRLDQQVAKQKRSNQQNDLEKLIAESPPY